MTTAPAADGVVKDGDGEDDAKNSNNSHPALTYAMMMI